MLSDVGDEVSPGGGAKALDKMSEAFLFFGCYEVLLSFLNNQ